MSAQVGRWAELALAIGGFGIGTGEFVMMGLLPDVAGNFNVSIPSAGHVISASNSRWRDQRAAATEMSGAPSTTPSA